MAINRMFSVSLALIWWLLTSPMITTGLQQYLFLALFGQTCLQEDTIACVGFWHLDMQFHSDVPAINYLIALRSSYSTLYFMCLQ